MSLLLSLVLVGCGGAEAPTPAAHHADKTPTEAVAASHEGMDHAAQAFVPLEGEGKRVFFLAPADGAMVTSPLAIRFGAEGIEVRPAGALEPGTGHHHLVIDGGPVPADTVVPADATHIHYGKGQTEVEVELTPGTHTLTMQLADGMHRSYGADFSATITVTVEGAAPAGEGAEAGGEGTP